jgi:single-stranded-DNA-specific exonuclease
VQILDQERWFLPALGLDAEEVSNRQSAAGRAKMPGVGVAYALGDPSSAERVRLAEDGWRSGVLRGLRRLEDEGVNSMSSLQWFESPDTTLAGTQAGMAILYLLDPERPVFAFSEGSGPTQVSARATLRLVDRGVDLTVTCARSAAAVGGEGGGHRVASGATIPAGTREKFLAEANEILGRQLSARTEAS